MYIEAAYRLDEKFVKADIVRPIHRRRVTIASMTDTFRVTPNAHADMRREVDIEPYNPPFGGAGTAEAA